MRKLFIIKIEYISGPNIENIINKKNEYPGGLHDLKEFSSSYIKLSNNFNARFL